jgi:acyl carrier protein
MKPEKYVSRQSTPVSKQRGRAAVRSEQEIREQVAELIREIGGKGDADVSGESSLGNGGFELTSLELMRLLVEVEERLGVEVGDDAIMNTNFEVVDDVVSLFVGCEADSELAGDRA